MMPKESQATRVRQGETRGHMRTVLLVSTTLAVVAMLIAWAIIR